MLKINKYFMLLQLMLFNIITNNIVHCAATIMMKNSSMQKNAPFGAHPTIYFDATKECAFKHTTHTPEDKDQFHKRSNGTTALDLELIMAAQNGNKGQVKLLIGQGANINAANEYGSTALILAARHGYKEIVELLIKSKDALGADADINAADKWGNTALIWAAFKDLKEIFQILLLSGADIEQENNEGQNALDMALGFRNVEIVKMLESESLRREKVVKKFIENNKGWIKEILARKITEVTSEQLFSDISNIIVEYRGVEYTDIPLEYRLAN